MKKILIFSFMILVGFGCKKENSSTEQAPLLKTKWLLACIQNTKTNAITNYPSDASRKISIVFIDSLNVLSFSGICNGGSGTYSYSSSNGSIKITGLCTTSIYCKYEEWEEYTGQNLNNAFSYKINGKNLIIYSNSSYNLYFNQN